MYVLVYARFDTLNIIKGDTIQDINMQIAQTEYSGDLEEIFSDQSQFQLFRANDIIELDCDVVPQLVIME